MEHPSLYDKRVSSVEARSPRGSGESVHIAKPMISRSEHLPPIIIDQPLYPFDSFVEPNSSRGYLSRSTVDGLGAEKHSDVNVISRGNFNRVIKILV